jgi:hypothetical protein
MGFFSNLSFFACPSFNALELYSYYYYYPPPVAAS